MHNNLKFKAVILQNVDRIPDFCSDLCDHDLLLVL